MYIFVVSHSAVYETCSEEMIFPREKEDWESFSSSRRAFHPGNPVARTEKRGEGFKAILDNSSRDSGKRARSITQRETDNEARYILSGMEFNKEI